LSTDPTPLDRLDLTTGGFMNALAPLRKGPPMNSESQEFQQAADAKNYL